MLHSIYNHAHTLWVLSCSALSDRPLLLSVLLDAMLSCDMVCCAMPLCADCRAMLCRAVLCDECMCRWPWHVLTLQALCFRGLWWCLLTKKRRRWMKRYAGNHVSFALELALSE
jgi:hypothetical protein